MVAPWKSSITEVNIRNIRHPTSNPCAMANDLIYRHEYKAKTKNGPPSFRSESSILLVHKRTDLALTKEQAGGHSGYMNRANGMTVRKSGASMHSLSKAVTGFPSFGRKCAWDTMERAQSYVLPGEPHIQSQIAMKRTSGASDYPKPLPVLDTMNSACTRFGQACHGRRFEQ
jgi:hypothetical protein